VAISPTSLTFKSENQGTTSPVHSVMLTNSGNAALSVTTISVGGQVFATGVASAGQTMLRFPPQSIGSLPECNRSLGSRGHEAAGRRNEPDAVAQENEWQKKTGLPDSIRVGITERTHMNV
jgi:hypothetical protein